MVNGWALGIGATFHKRNNQICAREEVNLKKVVVYLAIALAAVLLGFLLVKNYSKNIPVFVPAFTPPKEDIRKSFTNPASLKFRLQVPAGRAIGIYADLKGQLPRVLAFDPNGVLFASLTGSGKVVALPGKNGRAERVVEVLTGLNNPHGLAFAAGKLYVAESQRVVRYAYDPKTLAVSLPEVLFSLPSGSGHFTRTIRIHDGQLYTTVGSSCNVCAEKEQFRAAMLVSDLDGRNLRVLAKGLRNTVFFTFDQRGQIWGNDMGRDFLGDSLPPDELNLIADGQDYGWPLCYGNKIRDQKYQPGQEEDYCPGTADPKFTYPAHVAPLGIVFDQEGNLLMSFHGSWNSSLPVGYKIVKLTLAGDRVVKSEDYITGWLKGDEVLGRPVDLIFDQSGNLYISDDKAGLIYVVFFV